MFMVTTNDVPGYRVTQVLGEVMGLTVRSMNFGQGFTAGFRAIGGGEIPEYTQVMYESRYEVMNRLWAEATQRGANAVIAMRFDTGALGSFTEVCAYGTAVVIEPIAGYAQAPAQPAPPTA
ncbi:YbjQ family protein [Microbacterium sp. 22242]|uniref:YbjQ family protein n=1 Tax=Microbacterium sp. 22242 TaxID=3453896 RepID=UPI003F83F72F